MIINVKGQQWDVEKVDGNTVILQDGSAIVCNENTIAEVNKQMEPKRKYLPRSKR